MTAPLTPEALASMRATAEAATPGPWEVRDGNVEAFIEHVGEWGAVATPDDRNAPYIATFDPPTVLVLLDEVDALKAEVERLRVWQAGTARSARKADAAFFAAVAERDRLAEGLQETVQKSDSWYRENGGIPGIVYVSDIAALLDAGTESAESLERGDDAKTITVSAKEFNRILAEIEAPPQVIEPLLALAKRVPTTDSEEDHA